MGIRSLNRVLEAVKEGKPPQKIKSMIVHMLKPSYLPDPVEIEHHLRQQQRRGNNSSQSRMANESRASRASAGKHSNVQEGPKTTGYKE